MEAAFLCIEDHLRKFARMIRLLYGRGVADAFGRPYLVAVFSTRDASPTRLRNGREDLKSHKETEMSELIRKEAFTVLEGRPVTSSRIVAEYFDKRHNDVLRTIREIIAKKAELAEDFIEIEEQVATGKGATRTTPVIMMDKKGFAILAMGFTGAKALDFKVAFYDEFERMDRELHPVECPANPRYLTDQQCWAIQSAVGKRAKGVGAHFQTIYRALKAHFQVPTYTRILEKDFNAALEFIATCELKAPVKQKPKPVPMHPQEAQRHEVPCPCCGRYPVPEGCIVLSREDAERIRTFIYQWKYVFRRPLDVAYEFLCAVDSPMRGRFWEAVHDLNLSLLEATLERQGLPALRN